MRLIDGDTLKQKIHEHDYRLRDEFNTTDRGMFTIGIDYAIDNAPTVSPKQGRWIPTWQELPQDNRFVLVCNDDERIAVAQYIGHEIDSYHPWQIAYCPYDVDIWEDSEHGKIMAWMELPKPYREGEKDDKEGSTDVFERLRKRILR